MTLALAMILDALLGEPKWLWSRLPHPAVVMGRMVGHIDHAYNHGTQARRNGVISFAGLCLIAVAVGLILQSLPLAPLFEILLTAMLLAQRSLVDHVRAVGDALRLSTSDGRMMVARIVGRDTAVMDDPAIARAAIESAAENFSDGVVAPIFWFAIGGLPGILLYKMTNTADSMIGYRTPRHHDFGWAAARFDDLLNWVPARITALVIAALAGLLSQRDDIAKDARRHRSPNAGWPEAALARALDVSLAGPRAYDGELRDFPYVHPNGRAPGPTDIDRACAKLWQGWVAILIITIAIAAF